jgi:hypothetical protein
MSMLAAEIRRSVLVPLSPEKAKEINAPCAWGENVHELHENWKELHLQHKAEQEKNRLEDEYELYLQSRLQQEEERYWMAEQLGMIGY